VALAKSEDIDLKKGKTAKRAKTHRLDAAPLIETGY